jgi:hypothetical protein
MPNYRFSLGGRFGGCTPGTLMLGADIVILDNLSILRHQLTSADISNEI